MGFCSVFPMQNIIFPTNLKNQIFIIFILETDRYYCLAVLPVDEKNNLVLPYFNSVVLQITFHNEIIKMAWMVPSL